MVITMQQNQLPKNQPNLQDSPDVEVQDSASVIFQTYPTDCGHVIAEMTLNSPRSLNALSVDMCQRMSSQLLKWQQDDRVVAVLLRGAGEKAFCAGGDIRKLYDSMCEHSNQSISPNPYATEFFGSEYDLYRQMHFYPKPLILWGNGIIMGGGMGLMAGCSHRIVTETTRFAMPEITIGLFPDATGSWFLQRMPAKIGLFLGLTGAQCFAADAMLVNLAEYALPSSDYEQVVNVLTSANWDTATKGANPATNKLVADHHASATVSRVLAQLASQSASALSLKPSKLAQHWQAIHTLMNCGGLVDIDALLKDDNALARLDADFVQDNWSQKAINTYRQGCPVTAALTYELFYKVADLSLEQILYLEANVAVNCANHSDFREGVRALLIDKDKNPTWSRTLAECMTSDGQAYVESHFHSPYPEHEHPFKEWLSNKAFGVKAIQ